jgi:hypothetical protein
MRERPNGLSLIHCCQLTGCGCMAYLRTDAARSVRSIGWFVGISIRPTPSSFWSLIVVLADCEIPWSSVSLVRIR